MHQILNQKRSVKKKLAQNYIETMLNHFENHKNIFLINFCNQIFADIMILLVLKLIII